MELQDRLDQYPGYDKVQLVQDIQVGVQWVAVQLAVQGRGEVDPGPLQGRQWVEQGRHQVGVEAGTGRGTPLLYDMQCQPWWRQ